MALSGPGWGLGMGSCPQNQVSSTAQLLRSFPGPLLISVPHSMQLAWARSQDLGKTARLSV